ncbi:FABP family protein [Saccharopolyspora sp. K220]|uniref:FABP family protein n=1 Tax=Saccharopolyspora soli TaxID=2926618 RepID=UPI001F5652F3|nr:FABP family protein [Saccharopolyspora soli]MCI2417333.1 FABP family protein [Saccharopolyspora soli]
MGTSSDRAPLPIPADTADLRSGPSLHDACGPLRALVGVWRGDGEVDYPSIEGPYRFGQQLTISHDGRPFLRHEARAWLLDAAGEVIRPAAWETGWWRPQPDGTVELLISHCTGILELFYGTAGQQHWELSTDTVVRTASAKDVEAAQRSYALNGEGALDYTESRAMVGLPMTPHVAARLNRIV